ncbi:unnamed protein product [Polarella glacialis]|uniref:Phytanoyl-CoA dioxygenase n=1 Tax=Polarella glacialis TaxID=89957 RepID=A0A813LPT2_POLGL|nr:unnamed protein product [Polarella glacialis]
MASKTFPMSSEIHPPNNLLDEPFAAVVAANADYEVQRASLQELVGSGASPEVLSQAHARLKVLKARHAELVRASKAVAPKTCGRGWASYPPRMDVPRDLTDPRFVQSFAIADHDEARAFMSEYGFVVFRDAISDEECVRSRDEIWSYLENRVAGFSREDPTTWRLLSDTDTGRYYDAYGLPPDNAIFSPQILQNRQHPNVVEAFQTLLGDDDILMSHDRWCLYRHTQTGAGKATRMNLHLDLHPWRYLHGHTRIEELRYQEGHDRDWPLEIPRATAMDGPHVQGVLNLVDNFLEDGGTQLVPGFHGVFCNWQKDLGDEADWVFQPGQETNWLQPGDGGSSFKFHEKDPIYALAHRVPMKQGSLLVWDQRLVHGSCPNASSRVRMAQFLRAFRRAPLSSERLTARALAVHRKVEAAGLCGQVSALGARVFGWEHLPPEMQRQGPDHEGQGST